MKKYITFLAIFIFGFMTSDILKEEKFNLISAVYADVAGMNYRDLRRDRDFRKAVKHIIENCDVGSSGQISC
jgi:hypothetical protein